MFFRVDKKTIECGKKVDQVVSSFAITNTLKMAEKGVLRPVSISINISTTPSLTQSLIQRFDLNCGRDAKFSNFMEKGPF